MFKIWSYIIETRINQPRTTSRANEAVSEDHSSTQADEVAFRTARRGLVQHFTISHARDQVKWISKNGKKEFEDEEKVNPIPDSEDLE